MKRMIIILALVLLLSGCAQTAQFADEHDLVVLRDGPKEAPATTLVDISEDMVDAEVLDRRPGEEEDVDRPLRVLSVNAFQFGYEPATLTANLGDDVMLTVTSLDVTHGFALPDFGINKRIPAEESVTFRFVADRRGEFEFFNSVYSGKGWKDMEGKFIVR